MKKYTNKYNNNFNKNLLFSLTKKELYSSSNEKLDNINNIYENPTTAQCVFSPPCDIYFYNSNSENNFYYENSSYILSAGNDRTIRYWDISKEGLNEPHKKSCIVNTPINMTFCEYNKSIFPGCQTIILQSNETFNDIGKKMNMPGFSDYQNYNGVQYHSFTQNYFTGDLLDHCSRISDASHKSVITDLLVMNLDSKNSEEQSNNNNILISSSWDGTIKFWN